MNLFLVAGIALLVYMTALFLLALWLEDNSIVDIAYGPGFILVGWVTYLLFGTEYMRAHLLLLLINIWGFRLAIHIFLRKQNEQGEDPRYRQWRENWGKTFVWRSFLQIYLLQGSVIYLVGMPMLLVINQAGGPLGWLDLVGLVLWLFGFAYEAIGDWQLLRFKQNPDNRGKILRTGLWSTTRHPNYFGEATLWWGVFFISLGAPYGWLAIISPLLICFLLVRVSGIPMLEAKYIGRPEFEAYRKCTNAFFPWFPKCER